MIFYISLSAFISFIITYLMIPQLIPLFQRLKAGQTIRDEGPESHRAKTGTPTMGGLAIIAGVTGGVLVSSGIICFLKLPSRELAILWTIWILFFGHGVLGFLDDYIKVTKKQNLGLTAKGKLIGQILLSLLLAGMAFYLERGTVVGIPGTMFGFDLGIWGYGLFVLIVVIGTSNAVNLTDGLDGLAAGTTVVSCFFLALFAFLLYWISGGVFSLLIGAACLGFLKYNYHPAKIFMGDTGSLAIGGGLAAIGVLTKMELILIPIGIIYVAEAMSVMIQVVYFKATGGKRFFRMSPLHHHFELGGWSEKRVVWTFWSVGALVGVLTLGGLFWLWDLWFVVQCNF